MTLRYPTTVGALLGVALGAVVWGCEGPTRPEPQFPVLAIEAVQDTTHNRLGLRVSVGDSLWHASWCFCEQITIEIEGLQP